MQLPYAEEYKEWIIQITQNDTQWIGQIQTSMPFLTTAELKSKYTLQEFLQHLRYLCDERDTFKTWRKLVRDDSNIRLLKALDDAGCRFSWEDEDSVAWLEIQPGQKIGDTRYTEAHFVIQNRTGELANIEYTGNASSTVHMALITAAQKLKLI